MTLVENPQARVSSFMGQGSGATAWARVGDSKTAAMPESLGAGVAAGDRISTSAARYGNHYALLLTYNQAKDAPPASRFLTDRQCSLLGGPFLLLPRWVFTALRRLRYSSGWLCLRYSMISKSSFFTRLRSSFST